MTIIFNEIKNYLLRSLIGQIKNCEIYKIAFAHFHLNRIHRNSSLLKACQKFEDAYLNTSNSGNLVNDFRVIHQDGVHIRVQKMDGSVHDTINLATNSYNDLELEETPRKQLAEYVLKHELSSCLSRKIAGQLPIHSKLEAEICDFLDYESCVLATSGYIAQQAVMFGLFHSGDVIFSDEHNHSSLVDGMRLTQAKIIVYPHLDYDKLEKLIQKYRYKYNCAGIVSDGVFSAHGTMANIERIHALKKKYNLISVIDDTHGFAAIGSNMRGVIDFFQFKPDVLTASLAKGLAGFGGVVLGSKAIVRVIDCMGRQNINTSHLSPLVAAQSYFNLKYLRENLQEIKTEQISKVKHFNQKLKELGIQQYESHEHFAHPIFSYYGQTEEQVISVFKKMLHAGYTAAFFPQPVSPMPTIRFSLHRKIDFQTLTSLAHFIKENHLQALSKEYWPQMSYMQKNELKKNFQNIQEENLSSLQASTISV